MPENIRGEARLTITDLSGAVLDVIEDSMPSSKRLLQAFQAQQTQSIGNQGGSVQVDNALGRTAAWTPGCSIKLEARLPGSQGDYSPILDGYLDTPEDSPGTEDPFATFQIAGWMDHLDLATIEAEQTYDAAVAWTTAAGDLIDKSTLGSGYARSITADAALIGSSGLTVPAETSLRQALEIVRAGLNQGTDKWELTVEKVAGAKTIRLFKRASTVQRTIYRRDLYPESKRRRGSLREVANKVRVVGDTVSKAIQDKTTLTHTAYARLDASTKRLSHPFTAPDSPLYGVSLYAARSKIADPPTLTGIVARNSDNVGRTSESCTRRMSALRNVNGCTTPDLVDDKDTTNNGGTYNGAGDGVYREYVVWDAGVGKSVYAAHLFGSTSAANAGWSWKLQGSSDDSIWTDLTGVVASATAYAEKTITGSAGPWRYLRIVAQRNSTGISIGMSEVCILEYQNTAADSSAPGLALEEHVASTLGRVATTGASLKEAIELDLRSLQSVAKIAVKHQESTSSSLLTFPIQVSADGSTWIDVGNLPSTSALVIDTILIEEIDVRYIRVLVDDDRAAASVNINCDTHHFATYYQVPLAEGTFRHGGRKSSALLGDSMKGSTIAWDVSALVTTPGTLEQRTYPTPRLAVVAGRDYWVSFSVNSGSTTSYWDLSYGTSTGAVDALQSTDSGTTWTPVATDAVLRMRLEFNHSELVGTAEDAASQATYANFITNGILKAAYTDLALKSQAAVDAKAAMIVNRNKGLNAVYFLVIQGDPTLVVGQRVTLADDGAEALGAGAAAIDLDVVEVRQVGAADRYVTMLTCGEHLFSESDVSTVVASISNQRRI